MRDSNRGSVLIVALLIIIAMSVLIASAANITLSQSKIAHSYHSKFIEFKKAEQTLVTDENWLLINQHESPPAIVKISTAVCGVTFYRIFVYSSVVTMQVVLQSTFAIVDPNNHCKLPPKINSGRQSWVMML